MAVEESKKLKMASIRERLRPDTMLKISFDRKEEETTEPRFILGYWSIRGLAAPIRAMLSAAQVGHAVAMYDLTEDEGSGWEMVTYAADKKWLREEFDSFMNLPFLMDTKHDLVVAQTNAIYQYLARELKMEGNCVVEQAKVDEMLCECMDLRDKMVGFCYGSDGTKEPAQAMLKRAKVHLKKFEAHLAHKCPAYFQNLDPNRGNDPMTIAQAKGGIAHLIPGSFTAPDFTCGNYWISSRDCAKVLIFRSGQKQGTNKILLLTFKAGRISSRKTDCTRTWKHLKRTFMLLPENSHYIGSFLHTDLPCNNCSGSFASSTGFRPYVRGQDAPWRKRNEVIIQYHKLG